MQYEVQYDSCVCYYIILIHVIKPSYKISFNNNGELAGLREKNRELPHNPDAWKEE